MDPSRQTEMFDLLDTWCEKELSFDGAARLDALLKNDAEARWQYLCYMELHGALQVDPSALANLTVSGTAPAALPSSRSVSQHDASLASWSNVPSPAIVHSAFRTFTHSVREVFWHPMALILLVGCMAAAIAAYRFSTGPTERPIAVRPPAVMPGEPAARLVGTQNAQWLGSLGPDGETLTPGKRLFLERGAAEIAFQGQARVALESPAEIVIVDGGACRLSAGRLTAYCPEAAKGFQVRTPSGTVTDLGTEFGVFVNTGIEVQPEQTEEEQQPGGGPPQAGSQLPVTEVHVFQGKVDFTSTDQLAQDNSPSKILSAGEAVTISENKVQPLPAADPFSFAQDKLRGQPRTVLLSDDFETYELGKAATVIGPWIVQSGTRKGQGVSVEDPAERIATANATAEIPDLLPAPPTLIGSRVANFGTSPQNSTDTYPVLSREIDGKLLAKNCQVLVEFDFFPRSPEPQLSVALATEVGHTAGIELSRSVDAAKQSVDVAKQGVDDAKKVDFVSYRWYRMRVLLSVADGVVGEVRVDRYQWRGSEGWVRDLSYQPPTPKLDWSIPPRYAIFGFPVVSPATVGGVFWLDNVRIEVIAKK